MVDLHRHDEYSTFDGFGKAKELAKIAKQLGHTSLGITNHGNTNGLIQHYFGCMEEGIKPIMGIETYFLPKYKEQTRGFHLCLFVKNLEGYGNLNKMLWDAEQKNQKYYNTIVTFEQLKKYSKGLICSSACVAGYLSQCLIKGNVKTAKKAALKFKEIFGDDFYIEIQPYKIDEEKTQESVNVKLFELAEELEIKCILTSDSHYGSKEDFPTYLKMHEIAKHDTKWVTDTYGDRYMPTEIELRDRFVNMHHLDFQKKNGIFKSGRGRTKAIAEGMLFNLKEIENKVDDEILSKLELNLPSIGDKEESFQKLKSEVQKGLKKHRKRNDKEYKKRCSEELKVIKAHGFSDYFLIVQDYVMWAKKQGIFVGPGRGSVCNSQIAYELGITTVDSLRFGLDFRRFLRMDKKKLPDVDLDFETSRRGEVIEYMVNKYPGHASQICSYGLYKLDNLINDLAKVCGLDTTGKEIDEETKKARKKKIAEIKSFLKIFENNEGFEFEKAKKQPVYKEYNKEYDNILVHFEKLYKKVRYIGTHAAGVAITGGNLLNYVGMRKDKSGKIFTNYDLSDLDKINVVKFDFLGLKTMESIGELRRLTGKTNEFDITNYLDDKKVLSQFAEGNTDGVFQFVSSSAKNIAKEIHVDNFEDVTAVSAMNRPGPLSLKMPTTYANNKANVDDVKNSDYYEYTKDTYGTIVYQEQLMQICVNIGEMEWQDADKVMKLQKRSEEIMADKSKRKDALELTSKFVKGAMNHGYTKEQAEEFFHSLLVYTFNKGHAVGYSLISFEEMYYKVYYPTEYWYVKIKYANDEVEAEKFCEKAILDDVLIFLPHVNLSKVKTSLRKEGDGRVIQKGLSDIKGIGEKTAEYIYENRKENGFFRNYDNFYDRCKSRAVTSKVVSTLKEHGAVEFNKKVYISRIKKYNSSLYMRGLK